MTIRLAFLGQAGWLARLAVLLWLALGSAAATAASYTVTANRDSWINEASVTQNNGADTALAPPRAAPAQPTRPVIASRAGDPDTRSSPPPCSGARDDHRTQLVRAIGHRYLGGEYGHLSNTTPISTPPCSQLHPIGPPPISEHHRSGSGVAGPSIANNVVMLISANNSRPGSEAASTAPPPTAAADHHHPLIPPISRGEIEPLLSDPTTTYQPRRFRARWRLIRSTSATARRAPPMPPAPSSRIRCRRR